MSNGKLITFEGCEGCGKSTQIKMLAEYLAKCGTPYLLTREPGGGSISEQIRRLVLDGKNSGMSDECEALLYAAAREQHLKDVIVPALNQGKVVLCDRYIHSSLAYQGYARGLGMQYIKTVNARVVKKFMPDITVFFDLAPEDAFLRKHGADKDDRMEQLGLGFHQRVYDGYKVILANEANIYAVDCKGTRQETHANVIALLKDKGIID